MKRVAILAVFFTFALSMSAVASGAYKNPTQKKSPDGKMVAKAVCDSDDYCWIEVKSVGNKTFSDTIKLKKGGRYVLQGYVEMLWSKDGKYLVFNGLDTSTDCYKSFVAIYTLGGKKFSIVDSAFTSSFKLEKTGFSYKVIEKQIYTKESQKKCETGIQYKMIDVQRDFNGKIIKKSKPYLTCGEGFC